MSQHLPNPLVDDLVPLGLGHEPNPAKWDFFFLYPQSQDGSRGITEHSPPLLSRKRVQYTWMSSSVSPLVEPVLMYSKAGLASAGFFKVLS